MEEIEIIIDKDGTVHMDAKGFHGKGCHVALEEIAAKLGKVASRKNKAEFYQNKVTVGAGNKVRG